MNSVAQDLWPDDIVDAVSTTPASILKVQAGRLGQKTKNLVQGQVETSAASGRLVHSFKLIAPALDNYTYELLRISHGVTLYPIKVEEEPIKTSKVRFADMGGKKVPGHWLQNEGELIDWLREALSAPQTRRIVGSLVSQSAA
jgi:hypothetical protein